MVLFLQMPRKDKRLCEHLVSFAKYSDNALNTRFRPLKYTENMVFYLKSHPKYGFHSLIIFECIVSNFINKKHMIFKMFL